MSISVKSKFVSRAVSRVQKSCQKLLIKKASYGLSSSSSRKNQMIFSIVKNKKSALSSTKKRNQFKPESINLGRIDSILMKLCQIWISQCITRKSKVISNVITQMNTCSRILINLRRMLRSTCKLKTLSMAPHVEKVVVIDPIEITPIFTHQVV